MIETECQALIVKATVEGGGAALKLNNRFLIGVVDLLVKLPGHQPMWLEAKLHNFSRKMLDASHQIADIGCTKLQKDFLRDWHETGMLTGVVSFLQESGGGVASLRMAVYSYEHMKRCGWAAYTEDHHLLGGPDERFTNIRQQLIEFANG